MSGMELFWQSGTWWFFVGQLAVVALVVYLYVIQGREEEKAKKKLRESGNAERTT